MTDKEWAGFVAELDYSFKGEVDEFAEAAYRRHLGAMDHEAAAAALALLVADGQVFTPVPGEIVAAARRVAGERRVPWAEAWGVIRKALWNCSTAADVVERVSGEIGEGPARFVQTYGVSRLRMEPTNDPAVGGAVLARMQRDYEDAVDAVDEDRKLGLALDMAKRAELGRPRRAALPAPLRALQGGVA